MQGKKGKKKSTLALKPSMLTHVNQPSGYYLERRLLLLRLLLLPPPLPPPCCDCPPLPDDDECADDEEECVFSPGIENDEDPEPEPLGELAPAAALAADSAAAAASSVCSEWHTLSELRTAPVTF